MRRIDLPGTPQCVEESPVGRNATGLLPHQQPRGQRSRQPRQNDFLRRRTHVVGNTRELDYSLIGRVKGIGRPPVAVPGLPDRTYPPSERTSVVRSKPVSTLTSFT